MYIPSTTSDAMMLVVLGWVQALNVVLTHTTADFDTLAAAVGLAKLWQDERPDDGEKTDYVTARKKNLTTHSVLSRKD